MCTGVLPASVYVQSMCLVRRVTWLPWDWGYRQLRATMWVLGLSPALTEIPLGFCGYLRPVRLAWLVRYWLSHPGPPDESC